MIKDIIVSTQPVNLIVIVRRAVQGIANNNNAYLTLVLQDNSGTINARLWDAKPTDIQALVAGQIVNITANSLLYNGELQLKITGYQILTKTQAQDHFDSLVASAAINIEQTWKELNKTVRAFKDPILKKILLYLFKHYQVDFCTRPAAVRIHHNVRGGLLWHTATMLQTAKAIVKIYHDRAINQDLLYAGIIMHDFGKIWELNDKLLTNFTLEGNLKGHIVLGSELVTLTAQKLKLDLKASSIVLLQHVILASHGKYEFGSPVLPRILEAEIVHLIDNLDAKITVINDALKATDEGEMTQRLVALDGRSFYKYPFEVTKNDHKKNDE